MSSSARTTLKQLSPLLGSWNGQGQGMFPTIESFAYREQFTLRGLEGAGYLTYEQATELIDAQGVFIRKSHWEAGVLRILEDGAVELACVHNSGRVEVLRGRPTAVDTSGQSGLQFDSILVLNDERMRSSSRRWRWNRSEFSYSMSMATSAVEQGSRHLEAELVKTGD